MTIRDDLNRQLAEDKARVAATEAKIAALEAEAGGWLDREEAELKATFSRFAAHFPWLHVEAQAQPTGTTAVG